MSDFITDVERQYEMYCKIAEEHGFIDLNAKKNGFRCTTKSNEFNAGWIAFVGAVAAVRDEQQAKIDELQKQVDALKVLAQTFWEKSSEKHKQGKVWESKSLGECADEILDELEQALKGGEE